MAETPQDSQLERDLEAIRKTTDPHRAAEIIGNSEDPDKAMLEWLRVQEANLVHKIVLDDDEVERVLRALNPLRALEN